jgi:hypothetical protein
MFDRFDPFDARKQESSSLRVDALDYYAEAIRIQVLESRRLGG